MEKRNEPSSSAMALRDAFGDRRIPDISRKITACVACRKLKIKCHMPDAPPCDRCKKRGLSCTVNRSLQQVLESDFSWKDSVENRLAQLEKSVRQLASGEGADHRLESHDPTTFDAHSPDPVHHSDLVDEQRSWEIVVDGGNAPSAVPASYISEITRVPPSKGANRRQSKFQDMIAAGILHAQSAETLFQYYKTELDPLLYGILHYNSLQDVRDASSLLTDAICTVAALHTTSENYIACRTAFMQQVSMQLFSKSTSTDDLRGLCIGAFWLSDLSWTLVGLAVRIANEINLNRAFVRPQYDSRKWYLNARLYLLVHVCDRHLSLVYGRAPMSETFHTLDFIQSFLASDHACGDDRRLMSQLEIWSINYRTYKTFGLDNEGALPMSYLTEFRRISIALDTWRVDWEEKLISIGDGTNSLKEDIVLHFDLAKLYLCSHAYRGITNSQVAEIPHHADLEEFSNRAVSAAKSIVKTIVSDARLQTRLNGLPTYFDTMIAFAVVFLLKVISKPQLTLHDGASEIITLLEQISSCLTDITSRMRQEHILCSIARSVKKLIEKATSASRRPDQFLSQNAHNDNDVELPWLISPDDSIFFGNFDLTGPTQEIDFNFMDFSPTN